MKTPQKKLNMVCDENGWLLPLKVTRKLPHGFQSWVGRDHILKTLLLCVHPLPLRVHPLRLDTYINGRHFGAVSPTETQLRMAVFGIPRTAVMTGLHITPSQLTAALYGRDSELLARISAFLDTYHGYAVTRQADRGADKR